MPQHKTTEQRIHDMIDDLIVANPGQFPDGPQFLHGMEFFLSALIDEGTIDQWSIMPQSKDGYKVVVENNGKKIIVLRNPDGGRQ